MDTTLESTINVKLPKANAMNIKNSQFGTKACYLITGNKKKTPKVVVLYLAWYIKLDPTRQYITLIKCLDLCKHLERLLFATSLF